MENPANTGYYFRQNFYFFLDYSSSCFQQANVENLERFYEEFGSGITEIRDDDNDPESPKPKKSAKPRDFQALLGSDNDNDHFMVGIKFTNR